MTGGVGAGKSTVLDYLQRTYRAEVILADIVGHEVMEPGTEAYAAILDTFGRGILAPDGTIDRRILGQIVFADSGKREALNAIVHPEVKKEILARLAQARKDGAEYAVVEAALFLEENYDAFCEETWYIYTDEEQRRKRLKKSRNYTDERIDQIFASQMEHEEFLKRCGYVINNNGTAAETCRQIDQRMKQ